MASESDELNYDAVIKPVIGNFDDEGDRAKFIKQQEKNVADAERISAIMDDKGVPDTKKPI